MNPQVPLVSVVIPTRDHPELLRRALDRLAPGRQALAPDQYEVIVSDDARPASAAAAIHASHPWVTVVEGPARGPAANRNSGARVARGAWLAFLDDDCLPDAGWLAAFARTATAPDAPEILEGRTTCTLGIRSPLEHAPVNERGGMLW